MKTNRDRVPFSRTLRMGLLRGVLFLLAATVFLAPGCSAPLKSTKTSKSGASSGALFGSKKSDLRAKVDADKFPSASAAGIASKEAK